MKVVLISENVRDLYVIHRTKMVITIIPPGKRKFAVVIAGSGNSGRELLPIAIATIAVMWVSGPKTWIGTPNVPPISIIIKNTE